MIDASRPVTLETTEADAERCAHVAGLRPATPTAPGCEECLATGDRWVHLRLCMECGHVGCCDSSRNRHATRHHEASGHAIVRSLEPGEAWGWCYEDQVPLGAM